MKLDLLDASDSKDFKSTKLSEIEKQYSELVNDVLDNIVQLRKDFYTVDLEHQQLKARQDFQKFNTILAIPISKKDEKQENEPVEHLLKQSAEIQLHFFKSNLQEKFVDRS
jgi:hypothetical protein